MNKVMETCNSIEYARNNLALLLLFIKAFFEG